MHRSSLVYQLAGFQSPSSLVSSRSPSLRRNRCFFPLSHQQPSSSKEISSNSVTTGFSRLLRTSSRRRTRLEHISRSVCFSVRLVRTSSCSMVSARFQPASSSNARSLHPLTPSLFVAVDNFLRSRALGREMEDPDELALLCSSFFLPPPYHESKTDTFRPSIFTSQPVKQHNDLLELLPTTLPSTTFPPRRSSSTSTRTRPGN